MDASKDSGELKQDVRRFWEETPCGTRGLPQEDRKAFFRELERERYDLEPYIRGFARFEEGRDKRVLEVGTGAGTDFVNWARNGAEATGVDLTEQGVTLTRERLALEGLRADVRVADAENLPFSDDTFDLVYSYGVVHHSPDTTRAIREIHRVLRPGGTARVMIYHSPSWIGLMLWGVHCAARGKPWKSPRWAMYHHLESPGTKSYGKGEARRLFGAFSKVSVRTQLSHGDLLLMRPSDKYTAMKFVWSLYPRPLVRLTGNVLGTNLFIEATK
jgi:SAM-dependent methyltransferase